MAKKDTIVSTVWGLSRDTVYHRSCTNADGVRQNAAHCTLLEGLVGPRGKYKFFYSPKGGEPESSL